MQIDKLKIAKGATKLVVYRCVGFVVSTAIATLVPTETTAQKIELFVGSNIIGAIVSDKASDLVDIRFAEAAEMYKAFKIHMKSNDDQ